ncbi:MAG: hypothetical protein QXI58_01210 [Candidatus Micrarchaeia archaeon]
MNGTVKTLEELQVVTNKLIDIIELLLDQRKQLLSSIASSLNDIMERLQNEGKKEEVK